MPEVKILDPKAKEFTANGKTYYIEDTFPIVRWKWWLKLQHKLGWGMTFEDIIKQFRAIYDVCNKPTPEPGMACILAYNAMIKVNDVQDENYVPEIIQMCALFMNTKDEDRTIINEAMIREKEKDWIKEGISMQSFFQFALASIPNFIPIYKEISQGTFLKNRTETEEESALVN